MIILVLQKKKLEVQRTCLGSHSSEVLRDGFEPGKRHIFIHFSLLPLKKGSLEKRDRISDSYKYFQLVLSGKKDIRSLACKVGLERILLSGALGGLMR